MRMRKVLAGIMAIALVGGIAAPSFVSKAEGLTQASASEELSYRAVTAEEKAILKTVFDPEYYLLMNPDLKAVVGNDLDKLFEHFCTIGIFERRACNADFDVSAYASAYPDLKDGFGLDIIKYYEHYATVGKAENRTLTTLEACANAGITVTVLSETPYEITPNTYKIAKLLGTSDFQTVNSAIEAAAAGNDVVVSSGTGQVVISWSEATEKMEGLTKVGEYKGSTVQYSTNHFASGNIYIYVDNNSYYAAYANNGTMTDGITYIGSAAENTSVLIYKTNDSFNESNKEAVAEIWFRACTPISAKSIISGSMPSGGIDVKIHSTEAHESSANVEYENESTGNYYSANYNDGWGWQYNDPKGDYNETYDISMKIDPNENGATVTFAISNEDNEYATIDTTEITNVTPPAAE